MTVADQCNCASHLIARLDEAVRDHDTAMRRNLNGVTQAALRAETARWTALGVAIETLAVA